VIRLHKQSKRTYFFRLSFGEEKSENILTVSGFLEVNKFIFFAKIVFAIPEFIYPFGLLLQNYLLIFTNEEQLRHYFAYKIPPRDFTASSGSLQTHLSNKKSDLLEISG
jgi:hypothetical protein